MTIVDHEFADLPTESGPMRTFVFRPANPGRYPGIVLFSEIFQATGPIRRTAALLAGNGFVVAVPEIFHEYEAPGIALSYDSAGADRGNWCKVNKPIYAYDSDALATVEFLQKHPASTGRVGAMGICIGGHLSFRCAMNPDVLAAVCFYATDIHRADSQPRGLALALGAEKTDDSLEKARGGAIPGELLMFWGRQDPHIPFSGRTQIREALETSGTNYQWMEVNGAHAFLRDEGPRYNPVLAQQCLGMALELFQRKLHEGDCTAKSNAGSSETRH